MLHRNPYVVFPKRCYPTGLVWCEYGYEVQSPMENGWLQARLRWATTQVRAGTILSNCDMGGTRYLHWRRNGRRVKLSSADRTVAVPYSFVMC